MLDLKPEEQLSQLFGSYKAEWLTDKIYEFFSKPEYFPELETTRPCMLIGGRGTGKTTVLRCLSYDGQFALSGSNIEKIDEWPYYGIYYRINTNRVTAFKGPEVSDEQWKRLFAHYFNLVMCDQLLRFLEWYYRHKPSAVQIDPQSCSKIAMSLNIANTVTLKNLAEEIDNLRIKFEAYINNIAISNTASQKQPWLSMQGAPIDTIVDALAKLPQFAKKTFFFLIDEYENLQEYQQQVINTLIKHSGHHYTFKISVRELGLRCRTTLNQNEQLISPADYVRININEKLSGKIFNKFALSVCNMRISKLRVDDKSLIEDISMILPELSPEEEAVKLGILDLIKPFKDDVKNLLNDMQSSLLIYFLKLWAEKENQPIKDIVNNYIAHRETWETRYQNYKHALLFTIRQGKSGIRKYYSGWNVFVKLAANNIRYLLELVEQSLLLHVKEGHELSEPIPPEIQTRAAQNTGKKNLAELEGLHAHGAKLTKLLLSLGRIFEVMAADVLGHTPEANQFYIEADTGISEKESKEVDDLLKAAIMHLALIRESGTKFTDEADTRDYDYMIHPIFSPFFVFSHRKKRKMKLTESQFLGLVNTPRESIKNILVQNNRDYEEQLPDQLLLFKGYYFGSP